MTRDEAVALADDLMEMAVKHARELRVARGLPPDQDRTMLPWDPDVMDAIFHEELVKALLNA